MFCIAFTFYFGVVGCLERPTLEQPGNDEGKVDQNQNCHQSKDKGSHVPVGMAKESENEQANGDFDQTGRHSRLEDGNNRPFEVLRNLTWIEVQQMLPSSVVYLVRIGYGAKNSHDLCYDSISHSKRH